MNARSELQGKLSAAEAVQIPADYLGAIEFTIRLDGETHWLHLDVHGERRRDFMDGPMRHYIDHVYLAGPDKRVDIKAALPQKVIDAIAAQVAYDNPQL